MVRFLSDFLFFSISWCLSPEFGVDLSSFLVSITMVRPFLPRVLSLISFSFRFLLSCPRPFHTFGTCTSTECAAETVAAAVFTLVLLQMVFVDTAATAVCTLAPLPPVPTDTTAAAVFAGTPLLLELQMLLPPQSAGGTHIYTTAAVFTDIPYALVMTVAAATVDFVLSPFSLLVTDASAATVCTLAPHPPVHERPLPP